jgi:hypothetical protein
MLVFEYSYSSVMLKSWIRWFLLVCCLRLQAARTGKTGMVWDLNIRLIGGKNLVPKDTVAEGTYGTQFTHRCVDM